MSYWVTLVDDYGQSVPVDAHTAGGVHEEGECRVAEMNVTSNYAKHFDFRMLDGKFGSQTIVQMENAVKDLGTRIHRDYQNPTPGNVGYVVDILLQWAEVHPDGVWRVK